MIEPHDSHLSWTFLVSVTRSSFFFRGSACAQRERSTHHLVGSGPQQGDGRGSDDPPRSWQDRCPCSTWTNAMRVKKNNKPERRQRVRGCRAHLRRLERLPLRPLAAPVSPACVLVSLRRRLCVESVFIPQWLLLHFTAKWTTVRTGEGCVSVGKWPVLAPLRTPTTRVEATWQTRLAVLTVRRRIWDVSDWSDGLAHRVATFLPVLLLPFHFVAFSQALRRLPPVTERNCMRQQRRIFNTAPSINNKTLLTDGSDWSGSYRCTFGVIWLPDWPRIQINVFIF